MFPHMFPHMFPQVSAHVSAKFPHMFPQVSAHVSAKFPHMFPQVSAHVSYHRRGGLQQKHGDLGSKTGGNWLSKGPRIVESKLFLKAQRVWKRGSLKAQILWKKGSLKAQNLWKTSLWMWKTYVQEGKKHKAKGPAWLL